MAITRIPPELLLHILQESGKSELEGNSKTSWYAYPWLQSHVCQRWHDLLLSSPMEWTYVKLSVPFTRRKGRKRGDSKQSKGDSDYARCKLQLERSKGLPLQIFIHCDESYYYDHGPAVMYLFMQSHRWKRVTFWMKELHLHGLILPALSRCQEVIESLSIDVFPCTGSYDPSAPMTLPNLRYLRVLVNGSAREEIVLRSFRLPALEELVVNHSISHCMSLDSSMCSSLERLLKSSQPADKLTKLTIRNLHSLRDDKDTQRMRSILQLCPQLESLKIHLRSAAKTSHPWMSLLVWGADSENKLCPRLSTLALTNLDMGHRNSQKESRAVLLDILASRSEVAAQTSNLAGFSDYDAAVMLETSQGRYWPERFLTDVRISFARHDTPEMVFEESELSRIRDLAGMMHQFAMVVEDS